MSRRLVRRAVQANLFGLLHVERLAALVHLEGRALQIHAELAGPLCRRVGRCAPPNAVAQSLGVWFETQQTGRVGEHWTRVRSRKSFTAQQVEEFLCALSRHVGVGLALRRFFSEI